MTQQPNQHTRQPQKIGDAKHYHRPTDFCHASGMWQDRNPLCSGPTAWLIRSWKSSDRALRFGGDIKGSEQKRTAIPSRRPLAI